MAIVNVKNPDGSISQVEDSTFFQTPKPVDKASGIRSLGDTLLKFGQGATGATKAVFDAAGANNAISRGLDKATSFLGEGLSDEAIQQQQINAQRSKLAQGKGWMAETGAALRNFKDAPIDSVAEGAGSIVPTIGAMALSKGKINPATAGVAMGGVQGAGAVKGSIYEGVKNDALSKGYSEQEADALATDAQAYSGQNADQIALGAGLGVVAGKVGAESSSFLTGQANKGTGLIRDTLKGFASEGLTEGAQGGQEQFASNIARNRLGSDVDPMAGVVGQGVAEGLAGGVVGGGFGAVDSMVTPRQQLAETLLQQNPSGVITQAAATAAMTGASDGVITGFDGRLTGVAQTLDDRKTFETLRNNGADAGYINSLVTNYNVARNPSNSQALREQALGNVERLMQTPSFTMVGDANVQSAQKPQRETRLLQAGIEQPSQEVSDNVSNSTEQQVTEMATQATGTELDNGQGSTGSVFSEPTGTGLDNATATLGQSGTGDIQRGTDESGVGSEALGDIDALKAQLDKAESDGDLEGMYNIGTQLTNAITQDTVQAINKGEMPVFKTGENSFITLSPSAQNEGKYQVTRYNKNGIMGDSQYNSIEQAISSEGVFNKRATPEQANELMKTSLNAEMEYNNRKLENAPTLSSTNAPESPVNTDLPQSWGEQLSQNVENNISNVDIKANEAATSPFNTTPEPTQAQKEAGNYKVGRINVGGLNISVENPDQSTRSGVDRDGKSWQSTMNGHYGYIKGVKARSPDKEHVDVNVKPSTPEDYSGDVFVINQNEPTTGKFDEPKVYIGYDNETEAESAYRSNYADDWQGFDSITRVPMSKFKEMLNDEKAFMKPVKPTLRQQIVERKQSKKSGTLLARLRNLGGVTLNDKRDITGEGRGFAPGGYNQVFRKDQTQSLRGLIERGDLDDYLPPNMRLSSQSQDEAYDSDDAYDYITDKIRNGAPVLTYEAEQELAAKRFAEQDVQTTIESIEQAFTEDELNAELEKANAKLREASYDENEAKTLSAVFDTRDTEASAGSGVATETGQETQARNEVTPTPRGDGEREGVRPLVEAIVKRRAAANQIGKSKPFDDYLQAAKDFMAGKEIKTNRFKLASIAFRDDKPLSDAYAQLAELAKQPAKQARNEVAETLQGYRDLIAQTNTLNALKAIARDIQDETVLSDAQVQELDDLVMDKIDVLSQPEAQDVAEPETNAAESENRTVKWKNKGFAEKDVVINPQSEEYKRGASAAKQGYQNNYFDLLSAEKQANFYYGFTEYEATPEGKLNKAQREEKANKEKAEKEARAIAEQNETTKYGKYVDSMADAIAKAKQKGDDKQVRVYRQNIFDAEDAVKQAVDNKNINEFEKFKDIFPKTHAMLQADLATDFTLQPETNEAEGKTVNNTLTVKFNGKQLTKEAFLNEVKAIYNKLSLAPVMSPKKLSDRSMNARYKLVQENARLSDALRNIGFQVSGFAPKAPSDDVINGIFDKLASQDLTLTGETNAEILAREQAQKDAEAEKAKADAKAKAEEDKRALEAQQRKNAAERPFEFGEDNKKVEQAVKSGSEDLFGGLTEQDKQEFSNDIEVLRKQLRDVERDILLKAPSSMGAGGGDIESAMRSRAVPTSLKDKRNALRAKIRELNASMQELGAYNNAPVKQADDNKPVQNTEDSGDELYHNLRNKRKKGITWSDLEGLNDTLRASEVTKQKIYPKPDYEELNKELNDPVITHIVKQVYDSISVKPTSRNPYTEENIKAFIEAINEAMDGVMKWARDKDATLRWQAVASGNASSMTEQLKNAQSLLDVIYPNGWRANSDKVRLLGGNKYLGTIQAGREELRAALKAIKIGFPSKAEAWQKSGYQIFDKETALSIRKGSRPENGTRVDVFAVTSNGRAFEFYDSEAKAQAFIDDKKQFLLLDKNSRIVSDHETEEQAKEAARAKVKRGNTDGVEIDDKGIKVEEAKREGIQHRLNGEDVSSDKIREVFGFRGINFGTWMKGNSPKLMAERQMHLNKMYDAFMDLAEIMNVPPKAISLNGMLGVAIGAQGKGGAAAHFYPGVNEINLTREYGAGSLGHEWAHAMDHYFAVQGGLATASKAFLTEHTTLRYTSNRVENSELRAEIKEKFAAIVKAMNKKTYIKTPEEFAKDNRDLVGYIQGRVDSWLKAIKRDFMANKVDEAEFDKLATRIREGDVGEGKVKIPNAGRFGINAISDVIDELRGLYKKATGRAYSIDNIKGLQSNVDSYLYAKEQLNETHVPQQVTRESDYTKAAAELDKISKKTYWNTNLEKFARAFDAYISDKLEAKRARNDYLSHTGRKGPTVPYDEERKAINEAFDGLISEIKTKETDNGNVAMFSRSQPAPTFYSQLSRAISESKNNRAPAGIWKAFIKNLAQKGVKPDEVEWTGINEWLDLQTGIVTKEQVLDYLDSNGVQVTETVLGIPDNSVAIKQLEDAGYTLEEDMDGEYSLVDEDGEFVDPEDLPRKLLLAWDSLTGEGEKIDSTKYSKYTVSGGKNYKELLLTLPEKEIPEAIEFRKLSDLNRERNLTPSEVEKYNKLRQIILDKPKTYKSSHFDQPNILAHVRFDERETFATGYVLKNRKSGNEGVIFWDKKEAESALEKLPESLKGNVFVAEKQTKQKTLFVQEIQSDWGQEGKKKGFKQAYITAVKDGLNKWDVDGIKILFFEKGVDGKNYRTVNAKGEQEWLGSLKEANDVANARRQYVSDRHRLGIQPAPFVTKTDAWVSLAIKRMMRYAVDNGFDKVAFINGQQAADLYDLSKQIDRIEYTLNDDGTADIDAISLDETTSVVSKSNQTQEQVADILGKDIAQSIFNDEGIEDEFFGEGVKAIMGDGLKVGGEGMRTFYDTIVPKVANDVLKKLGGGKVENVAFGDNRMSYDETIEALKDRTKYPDGSPEREALKATLETAPDYGRDKLKGMQTGFTITPDMREKIMGGLPLFRRDTQNGTAFSENVTAKIQADVDAITKGWKGAPDVVVVYDMNDERIPEGVRRENERQLSQGAQGQPEGFYVGGRAYIVASEMRSRDDVMRVLFHEVLGHSGLRGAFGDALKPMLGAISLGRRKEVIAKAKQYGLNVNNNKDLLIAAEEVLAELAQTKPELGLVQRAIAAIRTWLRNNVPYFKNMALSDAEIINNFILPARNYVENNQQVKDSGFVAMARRLYGDMMNVNDFVVPETPEFADNKDGTLAYTPIEAEKSGIKQLPIKLTVGSADARHRGFGLAHMADNASYENKRNAPSYTDDQAENFARHVAAIARTFDQIYQDGNKLVFRSSRMKEALIVSKKFDATDKAEFYSVVSMVPSVNPVWGSPEWAGRVSSPASRLVQPRASELVTQQDAPLGRQSLRTKSSKLDIKDLKTTSQEKSNAQQWFNTNVQVKRRRTYNMSDVDKGKFSRSLDTITVDGIEYRKVAFTKNSTGNRGAIEAYKDGKLIGDLSLYQDGDKYELSTINVTPQYRRQGIATEMLKQAQNYVGGNNIYTTMLTPDGRKFFGSMGIKRGDIPDVRNSDTILVDGIERPTLNSNGKPIHPTREGIENFWRWFGNSRVVDEQGKPLVVYHGTGADFDVFKTAKRDIGSHFGTLDQADDRLKFKQVVGADIGGQNMMPVYLKINNPLRLDDLGAWDKENVAYGLLNTKLFNPQEVSNAISLKSLISLIKSKGYDGVVYKNTGEVKGMAEAFAKERELGDFARKEIGYKNSITPEQKKHPAYLRYKEAYETRRKLEDLGEDSYITFLPSQIKSAIGNTGSFDANNDSILFSRSIVSDLITKSPVLEKAMNLLPTDSAKEFGFLKNIRTQYDKAQQDPNGFGRMFKSAEQFSFDARMTSARPAEQAPNLLSADAETIKESLDKIAKGDKSQKDKQAVAKFLFDGTLNGESVLDGKVFTDAELKAKGATDNQIKLYREARAAVNASLDEATASLVFNMLRKETFISRKDFMNNPAMASQVVNNKFNNMIDSIKDDVRRNQATEGGMWAKARKDEADRLSDLLNQVNDVFDHANNLKRAGYMPLSRFGKYSVTAYDENGEVAEFYRMDTEFESKSKAKQLAKEYARVERGVMPENQSNIFAGADPETVALFVEHLEGKGFDVKDDVMQEWYRSALSDRSALKRMLKRKGIKGFDDDLERVLSSFIISNSRFAANNYNRADMLEILDYLKTDKDYKRKGDVFDEAKGLFDYVTGGSDHTDPFSKLRSGMFTWFMGGSVASAAVNLTQPFTMTFPHLMRFTSATNAGKALTDAMKQAGGIVFNKQKIDGELGKALLKAREIGLVDPQETHHLYRLGAAGALNSLNASKDFKTRMSGVATLWGMMFARAESLNRYTTFIAAYNVAKQNKIANPFEFAKTAVEETQGIYGKENRPNWARGTGSLGAVGAAAFTFKQFSIAYVEMLARNLFKNGPAGRRSALMQLGILMLLSGSMGLPFADDEADLLDTLIQYGGGEGNTRRALRDSMINLLGEDMGMFALYGVSAFMPFDVQGRMGMGNLIPSTGLLMPSNSENRGRSALEIFGAGGSVVSDALETIEGLERGKSVADVAKQFVPVALKNVFKGADMYLDEFYSDTRGRRVVDTDGADALFKAVGFQPSVVAREQKRLSATQQTVNRVRQVESNIAELMARAQFESDPAKLTKARELLAEWNEENPDLPIVITPRQVINRVKQMRMTREERQLKATPKELRGMLS